MKSEDLFRAIGEVGEDLLARSEEKENASTAAPAGGKKRPRLYWIRFAAAAAACFLVLIGGVSAVRSLRGNRSEAPQSAEAAYEEKAVEDASEEAAAAGTAEETEEAAEEIAGRETEEAAPAAEEAPMAEEAAAEAAEAEEAPAEAASRWEEEPWQQSNENGTVLVRASLTGAEDTASARSESEDGAATADEGALDFAESGLPEEAKAAEEKLPRTAAEAVRAFEKNSAAVLLGDPASEENKLYSPLNLYVSMAMLSQITAGEAQQELLLALGGEGAEPQTVREAAASVLRRAAFENENGASRAANSLWIRRDTRYKLTPLLQLGEWYGASVFSGEMGSEEYNALLREWIRSNTDGLLEGLSGAASFDETTKIGLVSSLYYKAPWRDAFYQENTSEAVFHAPSGEMSVQMMSAMTECAYCSREDFEAVALPLMDGKRVCLFLPREGVTPEQLAAEGEWADAVSTSGKWRDDVTVDLAVPRFDIRGELKLEESLPKMGIASVFTDGSSFENVLDGEAYVSKAVQAVRVTADEEGVTGASAAVTEAAAGEPAESEAVPMIFDRPFLFAVADDEGILWFAGVVNRPE